MNDIVWLSDSPFTNTGYSTISRNILNGVSDEFDAHFLAHNFVGQTIPKEHIRLKDGLSFKFELIGAGREGYCKDVMLPQINRIQPRIFGVLLDTFMLYPWIMDFNFAPAKSVFYFPSDGGGGLPQDCDRLLRHFDVRVAMSKFGQRQAKEVHNLDCEYIPHAVDHNIFRPLSQEEKEEARANLETVTINGARIKGFLVGKFVVGTVARNQGRKMLDGTVKAFAQFCKTHQDAVLYLHTDPVDAAAVFDIRQLILRYNLENRVCFSNIKFYDNFEYSEMNKVYNVMDVFFLSTSGEGFGIPTLEAMSCEIPCAVTDYTTTRELLMEGGECGICIPIAAEITGNWVVERGVMSVDAGAQALETLYTQPLLRDLFGKTGRKKVLHEYTWDIVHAQWKDLFRRMSQ